MPLLNPHCTLHCTHSQSQSQSQHDLDNLDGELFFVKTKNMQSQTSSPAWSLCLIWLLLLMTMEPNMVFADQPNFDSHSNQDALDFSAHRQTKKKKPTTPGEPVPPPPPEGLRHPGNLKSRPSLLVLAHQLRPSDHVGTKDFGLTSEFHFTKPVPSKPLEKPGASSVIPAPSSLFLLFLAARHRRRRMTYGVRPNHGRIHHYFVRSSPGPNDQSRGIT